MTHTPGPWKRGIKTWDNTPIQVILGPEGEEIVQEPTEFNAYPSDAFVTPDGKEANMQLCCAAPELLFALKRLFVLVLNDAPRLLQDDHQYNIVADAIAKAERAATPGPRKTEGTNA
jgi:hypothetical protein